MSNFNLDDINFSNFVEKPPERPPGREKGIEPMVQPVQSSAKYFQCQTSSLNTATSSIKMV